jgi:type IV pilus assembly protein PilQ
MKLRNVVLTSLAALSLGAAESGPVPVDAGTEQGVQTLNLETTDKPLETVLQWISRRAGVNIVCNEADQPRVTLRLVNVTWQEAIEQIADRYDFVIERKSERIWSLTKPPKVRMEFQDARLTVVLEALARQANVNIVISDDIQGDRRLTMTLNGVPWRQALDVIVKATGYTWIEQDYSIIRVVSKDNVQKDLQTRVYRLNYTNGSTVLESIKVALSGDGKVQHDARTNSLVLTDTPPNLEAATKILDQLDTRTREVLIELKFVEFSTLEAQRLGFDPVSLGYDIANFGRIAGSFSPFASTPSATATAARVPVPGVNPTVNPLFGPQAPIPSSNGNLSGQATFEAIATLGSTEIIQTPQLLTLDNTKASIKIGREIRFAEQTVTQESGVTVVTLKEAASSPVTDGITIDVTPHITNDGYVSIELLASDENATLQEFSSGSGDAAVRIQLPQKASTKVGTNIMVADGQTAVIGGILKNKVTEDERSVPGINRIPVLNFFFKKTSDSVEQRNLTMFITPHVIPNNDKDVMSEESARLSERISGIQQRPTAAQQEQSRSLKE